MRDVARYEWWRQLAVMQLEETLKEITICEERLPWPFDDCYVKDDEIVVALENPCSGNYLKEKTLKESGKRVNKHRIEPFEKSAIARDCCDGANQRQTVFVADLQQICNRPSFADWTTISDILVSVVVQRQTFDGEESPPPAIRAASRDDYTKIFYPPASVAVGEGFRPQAFPTTELEYVGVTRVREVV
ncbi:hypothetical protein Scep_012099 [Stephania cephalantha]|uniref:Uncharacterized protein n=1 Tax=Stephania cephalantha TaxID=152367 RepID=A0AAP0JFY5_9MAGN